MSRFQFASFELAGRVAHMQALQGVTKLTVAVSTRSPSPEDEDRWAPADTAIFGLTVEDPGLREYAAASVVVGDLVMLKGRLSSTHFTSAHPSKPASGLRLIVTSLVAVPKRQADRLDAIPPFAEKPRSPVPF
ncbi:MAG: hypothetical protein DI537_05160 [Stutzerimonas stutzeri]|nr:MAG: hypothetical protein DI537_05160 [Stutzerimonas stutzeri]